MDENETNLFFKGCMWGLFFAAIFWSMVAVVVYFLFT